MEVLTSQSLRGTGKMPSTTHTGMEIPKGNGKTRLLGIPTVTDRLLQQAVLQIIMARFEFEFSESSFGFRPYSSLHQAVLKAQNHINDGYQ
jgi:RNA-directed DNA polymerase